MQQILKNSRLVLLPPVQLEEEIKNLFTIHNPEFIKMMNFKRIPKNKWPVHFVAHQKIKGKWITRTIARYLYYYEMPPGGKISLPQSAFFVLKNLYKQNGIKYKAQDQKQNKEYQFTFTGELKEKKGQLDILGYNFSNGIIQAPTGSGKTVMALFLCSKFNCWTCIVVDTGEILKQWVNQINQFLGVPKKQIGIIGSGEINAKPITVALMQTLRELPQEINKFSLLIIDECHIAATESYEKIINIYTGKNVLGLSATPKRKDGKTEVMHWLLGPTRVKINYENAERCPASVKIIPTGFTSDINFRTNYMEGIGSLINDPERNNLIAKNIVKHVDIFGVHLILSRRTEHLYLIQKEMPKWMQMLSRVLIGKINKKEREEIVQDAARGKLKFLFATESLLGKGFDEPLLSILHMATPIKDPDFLTQCIGRITRIHPEKKEACIFDYWDNREDVIGYTVKTRIKLYNKLNIQRRK